MTKPTVALVIHQNSTKNRGHFGKAETNTENYFYRWFSSWWTVKRSLISSLCLSTSICSCHHCYLCLRRLRENHLSITKIFCWNEAINFYSHQKKQFFFHANDKCTAFLRATEPNAIVPRSKYIILTKTYEPGRGRWGTGESHNSYSWESFFLPSWSYFPHYNSKF